MANSFIDWVVDQIEGNPGQQPTPDQVVDQIENNPGQQPTPTPDQVIDQIEGTIGQQPTPDYIIGGPDFNEPVAGLPSPIFGAEVQTF